MRWAVLAAMLALAACGDSQDPGESADAAGGACDAPAAQDCAFAGDCPDGYCVYYDTQHGFSSCTDYHACVATTLTCSPGVCDPDCEAALCPAPYTCDATATAIFTCVQP